MIGHVVVQLVTPAMIGGAEPRKCDNPPTLRPPSLRGHLRFWSRALGNETLATALWGEEKLGQRVRLLSAATLQSGGSRTALKNPKSATLLAKTEQHRETRSDMIPPGDLVILRFGIPPGVRRDHLEAVLWTWLHLGTVGRRSRRGYGSLQWLPSEGDLLSGWPPLWPSHHLTSGPALARYFEEGLMKVGAILGRPDKQSRTSGDDWRLTTLDQVFVGKELSGAWEASGTPSTVRGAALEEIVHGLNELGRGDAPDRHQLGSTKPDRSPSPIMWRLFPVHKGGAFLPVMTWFPAGYQAAVTPKLNPVGGVFKYLHDGLGFEKSLTGQSLA